MIACQFINALSDAKPQSHFIASASCTLLPETALVTEMRASDGIADTRFGCAPFARLTLLPDALWHDALTEGLIAALRPMIATPVSTDVVLDVTNIDDVVLAQVLRFLFNQAHRLSDLQLKENRRCRSYRAHHRPLPAGTAGEAGNTLPPTASYRPRHGCGATSG